MLFARRGERAFGVGLALRGGSLGLCARTVAFLERGRVSLRACCNAGRVSFLDLGTVDRVSLRERGDRLGLTTCVLPDRGGVGLFQRGGGRCERRIARARLLGELRGMRALVCLDRVRVFLLALRDCLGVGGARLALRRQRSLQAVETCRRGGGRFGARPIALGDLYRMRLIALGHLGRVRAALRGQLLGGRACLLGESCRVDTLGSCAFLGMLTLAGLELAPAPALLGGDLLDVRLFVGRARGLQRSDRLGVLARGGRELLGVCAHVCRDRLGVEAFAFRVRFGLLLPFRGEPARVVAGVRGAPIALGSDLPVDLVEVLRGDRRGLAVLAITLRELLDPGLLLGDERRGMGLCRGHSAFELRRERLLELLDAPGGERHRLPVQPRAVGELARVSLRVGGPSCAFRGERRTVRTLQLGDLLEVGARAIGELVRVRAFSVLDLLVVRALAGREGALVPRL